MTKRVKLKLNGLGAAADDFGRPRFLLLDRLDATKKPDYSAAALRRAIPDGQTQPFSLRKPDAGVVGEFWVVVPKRKQKWAAEEFPKTRGKEVCVEVALRRYDFPKDGKSHKGVALDLLDITYLSPASEAGDKKE